MKPDGYAVVLDDKSSPAGYWFAYAYIDVATAEKAASLTKGRVAPIYFAPPEALRSEQDCSRGGKHSIDQCHKCGAIFTLPSAIALFPGMQIDRDFDTVYIAFREEKDGDLAKNVRRRVDACIDVDAEGNVIGVELFDMPMPEEKYIPMEGDK